MGYIGRDNRVSTFTKQSITADGGTSFTLNQGVGDSSSILVSISGVVQQPDIDYTAAGTSLTFTSAPSIANPVWVIYLGKELTVSGETTVDDVITQTGVGDGTTTPLTLSNSVVSAQSIIVTLNGISQVPVTDFTVSGTTLTFTTAPSSAMAIHIYYIDLTLAENIVSDETVMVSSLASTGTWPAWDGSALTGIVGDSDITKLHDDVALLHFLRSIDSSSAISNMIEGWSDTFPNTTSVVDGSHSVPMVRFDGANDYLTIADGTLGQSDGKDFTVSFWIKMASGTDGSHLVITNTNGGRFGIHRDASNKIGITLRNTSNTTIANVITTNTLTESDGLTHVSFAINLGNSTQADRLRITLGGTLETNIDTIAPLDDLVDFTNITFYISSLSSQWIDGNIGQFYLAEEYVDTSVAANLALFVDSNGNSVDLGSNGSTPTGTQPLIFLNNPVATWQNNLGSGGNFTVGGELVDGGYLTDKVYSSTNFSNSYDIIDSYGKENFSTYDNLGIGSTETHVGQAITLASDVTITKIALYMRKLSGATGNMHIDITGLTGTIGSNAVSNDNIIAQSQTLDVSTVSTSFVVVYFVFPEPVTLSAGNYGIVANGESIASGANFLNVGVDAASTTHAGNKFRKVSGTWSGISTQDAIFYLYGSKNFTLTTKGSDSLTATSPTTAPTKGYFQALIDESPKSGTSVWSETGTNSSGTGWANYSVRQILSAANISSSGNKIRVTLYGPFSGATESMQLAKVAIVERSGSTANGTTTPTEILFGGLSGILIHKENTTISDWLDYEIDSTKDYLLIADFGSQTANDNIGRSAIPSSATNGSYDAVTSSCNTAVMTGAGARIPNINVIFSKLEVAVDPTINTDYIAEMSRDGGTTYSPAVLSRVENVSAGSTDRIVQGDVSFTGDPSGTNMVGRIRTVNNNKVTVKAMGINWD